MNRKTLFLTVIFSVAIILSSCALLKDPIDKKIGLTQNLNDLEISIRDSKWKDAVSNLKTAKKSWHKIKPLLQIDIDHDYVNDIENNFTMLGGYIEAESKPDSLATILLIKETWKDIGSL
jgi:hypothetical protein